MNDEIRRPAIPDEVAGPRVIAIARGLPAAALPGLAAAVHASGIRAFEVTMHAEDAVAGLRAVAASAVARGDDALLVGAGTVLSVADAEEAIAAGARFLVTPTTELDVVAWAAARNIPGFPGALTPTEILAAWRAGAAAVKVFPAGALGAGYLREVRGPLAGIPLIPTGGVTADNAPGLIAAGAVAGGLGGWLTGSGDPAIVAVRARTLMAALAGGARS